MAQITCRLSTLEDTKIKKMAREQGKSVAEYIRDSIFGEKQNLVDTIQMIDHIDNIEKYLLANAKNLEMAINLIYQFMRADIGDEKAKEIGDIVRKIITEGK